MIFRQTKICQIQYAHVHFTSYETRIHEDFASLKVIPPTKMSWTKLQICINTNALTVNMKNKHPGNYIQSGHKRRRDMHTQGADSSYTYHSHENMNLHTRTHTHT